MCTLTIDIKTPMGQLHLPINLLVIGSRSVNGPGTVEGLWVKGECPDKVVTLLDENEVLFQFQCVHEGDYLVSDMQFSGVLRVVIERVVEYEMREESVDV